MIELDQAQKQSVYQLLQKRNLEGYQRDVELLMLNQLNPTEALKLVMLLCEETERRVVRQLTEIEHEKLNRLVNGTKVAGENNGK